MSLNKARLAAALVRNSRKKTVLPKKRAVRQNARQTRSEVLARVERLLAAAAEQEELGNRAVAKQLFEKALAFESSPAVMMKLGELHAHDGQHQQAVTLFLKVLDEEAGAQQQDAPPRAQVSLALGQSLLKDGQFGSALRFFERGQEETRDKELQQHLQYFAALTHWMTRDVAQAEALIERLVARRGPHRQRARRLQLEMSRTLGHFEALAPQLQTFLRSPRQAGSVKAEAQQLLAESMLIRGDAWQALKAVRAAEKWCEADVAAKARNSSLAAAALLMLGEGSRAREMLRKEVDALDEADAEREVEVVRAKAEVVYRMALSWMLEGNAAATPLFNAVLDACNQVHELDPALEDQVRYAKALTLTCMHFATRNLSSSRDEGAPSSPLLKTLANEQETALMVKDTLGSDAVYDAMFKPRFEDHKRAMTFESIWPGFKNRFD